jgi:hypothetical protein
MAERRRIMGRILTIGLDHVAREIEQEKNRILGETRRTLNPPPPLPARPATVPAPLPVSPSAPSPSSSPSSSPSPSSGKVRRDKRRKRQAPPRHLEEDSPSSSEFSEEMYSSEDGGP